MLTKPNAEDLLKFSENRYELVIAVSRRARQIVDGDDAMLNKNNVLEKTTIAAEEFGAEKFYIIREEDLDEKMKQKNKSENKI